jgi:hypothetical protein
MRPLLKPALRRLWRDATTLQLGIEPGRALVLRGAGPREAAFVLGLDGTADRRTALDRASDGGLDRRTAVRLLDCLADHDALDDAALDPADLSGLSAADRDRLAPDLAALSLARRGLGGAGTALARRRRASVTVEGIGRVGGAVVGLLAAAGVGRVVPVDPRPLRAADLGPAGPGNAELGLARDEAAFVAARRTVPALRRDSAARSTVTVLAPDSVVNLVRRDRLTEAGLSHLPVTVLDGDATVGPLVHPGRTPCLRCVDLHHTDRDPAWPLLLAQLSDDLPAAATCAVVLATMAAAVASRLVLDYVDGPPGARPAPHQGGIAYVLRAEETLPRRRTYRFHPSCGCRWDRRP